ncbi:MAG: hypothetical protein Kow0062_06670 [Acidobacteriota bacterium]
MRADTTPPGWEQEVLDAWLARLRSGFPDASRPFLAGESDPFENPIGACLDEAGRGVIAHLAGRARLEEIDAALERLARLLAVQNRDPEIALRPVLDLRRVLAGRVLARAAGDPEHLAARVDGVVLRLFALWSRAREALHEARVRAERRRVASLLRRLAEADDSGPVVPSMEGECP